ncbi:LysR family transcriptional regulator [Arthrobacter cupressi]|uniref:ModE molybdate transport repressor domain-containing protein n=1 Tax=Arthrobacter cupressi TaxID=1045773 RepID=A0A1G8VWM5_9MICC|nr:LysR family transcriptional regulator [Arthrobacter cupressi]NYD78590.1 molybdate transport repressor ModE-like protein [Arthrobacter cupressi]SDJ70399.1 ModE molybdate transport repressor domain-containing protein [Arthrobacter cupressi]
MHLSIQSLRIFVTVAEAGSISAAARLLYMSQPSVSAHVRSLETSLAAHLLDRGPAGTTLTPAGAVLADHARRILGILEEVDGEVAAAQGQADRKLSVAGTSTLGSYLLPRVLSRFLAENETVRTELRVGNAEKVAEWIINREVSLAICAGQVDHEQLECTEIFDEALILAAGRAHPLAGRSLTPEDLAGQRFLLREIGSSTRLDQDQALADWGLKDSPSWTIWSAEAARESVRAGLGLALISEHVVAQDLRSGELVRLRINPAPRRRPVTLVRMADQPLTPVEQRFVELVSTIKAWPLG